MPKNKINNKSARKIPTHFNFYITDSFKPTYLLLLRLAQVDEGEEFVEYLNNIEETTVEKWRIRKGVDQIAAYIRFILTTHTALNVEKLKEGGMENERQNNN